MGGSDLDQALIQLRERVGREREWPRSPDDRDELARTLHELDVHRAELEIQNQDLVHTQRELSAARDRYRELFDHALVPLMVVSELGVIQEVNVAATQLLGRAAARLKGKPLAICLDSGAPDTFFRHLLSVAKSQGVHSVELTVRRPDGPRQVSMTSAPLPQSSSGAVLCQCADVTDQRRVEREKSELEARLREAETLEAVGRVAAAIAHDVNNVLVAVTALGEFLKNATRDSPAERDADALLDAAWRGAHMMRGLLGLSRGPERPRGAVDVAELVGRVTAMLRRSSGEAEIVYGPPSAPCWVVGDDEELLQAVFNVAKNALEATPRGTISLSCQTCAGDADHRPTVRVRVVDAGCGMSSETLARVYEPLFSTKRSRGGTGLGMTIVRKTVMAHDGAISIESRLKMGTTVTITLPLAKEGGTSIFAPARAQSLPSSMRVVIVDDDETVRTSVARQIAAAGAAAATFSGGPEAMAALAEHPTSASVLIVDVDMPVWSGPEFVQRLFDQVAVLPVVFITGAAGDQVPASMANRASVQFLRKPFRTSELVAALVAAAGEPRGEQLSKPST